MERQFMLMLFLLHLDYQIPLEGCLLREHLMLHLYLATLLLKLRAKKKEKGVYNIGSNFFEKNINIARYICKIFEKNPKKFIKFTDDRLYNDKRYSVSSKKIQKLGWRPKGNLLKDLPMIIEWYKKNYKIFKKI